MKDQFYKMRNAQHEQGLRDMISWLNNISPTKEMRMVEIGSYVGESTLMFAENFKHVISVDPYVDNYDLNDEACHYAPFYEVYKEFLKNTVAQDNIKSLKLDSATALPILSNYKFDLVYIDGIHTIEGVHHDIVNYMPLIKPGGFISGHDYGWGNIRHVLGLVFNDKVDAVFNDGSWVVRL